MIRVLALVSGMIGAIALSQFPEFSQQYLQRLSGAVNELRAVVTGFDLAAAAAGRTRDEALAEMGDAGFEGELKRTLHQSIRRHDRLSADLDALRAAGPLERLAQPWNLADREIFAATWADYRPAVPATLDGAITAGVGFVGGWGAVHLLLGALARPFRRRAA